MDQQIIAKQMIDMQKTAFENMMSSTITFWDQTGTAMKEFLNLATWLPEDGKKVLMGWVEGGRNGLENLKDAVDNGYSNFSRCLH